MDTNLMEFMSGLSPVKPRVVKADEVIYFANECMEFLTPRIGRICSRDHLTLDRAVEIVNESGLNLWLGARINENSFEVIFLGDVRTLKRNGLI